MKKTIVSAILATFAAPTYVSAAVTVDSIFALQAALSGKDKKINVIDTIEYDGSAPLVLKGKGHKIYADGDNTVLHVKYGTDLNVSGIRFIGPGGYAYDNNNHNQAEGGNAILLTTDALGEDKDTEAGDVINVEIYNTSVQGFGDHGIHLSDCSSLSCGDGNSGEGFGTGASFNIKLTKVTVMDTGFGQQDADGIRVDERAAGGVNLVAKNIWLRNVGADGIEIDEAGDHGVNVKMKNANFVGNGSYCAPAIFTLDQDPDDFDCFDEIDDGEVVVDLDDAFDIDEAGGGSVHVEMKNAKILANDDEGLDFDEAGDGGISFMGKNFILADNGDEGIKLSEEDAGNVSLTVKNLVNGKGETNDIEVESEDEGTGSVAIKNAKIDDLKLTGEITCNLSNVKFDGEIKDDGCVNLP